jgi:hypothetical protein
MPRTGSYYKSGYSSRSSDRLTGGTNDVNPQYMNLFVTQTDADTAKCVGFPIPVQRLKNAGRAQVMEILKVFWGTTSIDNVVAGPVFRLETVQGALTTKAMLAGPALVEPSLISQYVKSVSLNATGGACPAGTAYSFGDEIEPKCFDLTDGQGHGILVATDQLFITVSSFQTGINNTADCKILYRWKDVSMTEYVGIVQGQQ